MASPSGRHWREILCVRERMGRRSCLETSGATAKASRAEADGAEPPPGWHRYSGHVSGEATPIPYSCEVGHLVIRIDTGP